MNAVTAQLRHYITFLAGIGGLLLSWHLIAPEDVAKANDAGVALIEPLTVLAGLIGAGVTRLAITWVGKMFSHGTGESSQGSSGGMLPCVLGLAAAGSLIVSLSSCSPAQLAAVRAIPIKACYIAPDGTHVCYSSRDGVEVDVGSGK